MAKMNYVIDDCIPLFLSNEGHQTSSFWDDILRSHQLPATLLFLLYLYSAACNSIRSVNISLVLVGWPTQTKRATRDCH